ncbi:MAG: 2-oxoglutarate dehydrogenase complex dihydrolipoyllysine-residue succinyltransferase [Candidatus Margulisbacteria bacterium]|nr:2-oxoglutarate dehydrogenase complex dihydrolipoyllysine-residue succinyltransferase [Candidatus Margulisiibacteriota bacterium]
MAHEIKVPSAGESVTEADITTWFKQSGDYVEVDEELVELETDKASLPLTAEIAGILTISVSEGTVKVGQVIGTIAASSAKPAVKEASSITIEKPKASSDTTYAKGHPSPAAAKTLSENKVDPTTVSGTGRDGRITKEDAQNAIKSAPAVETQHLASLSLQSKRNKRHEKMSRMRRTIANRLVQAQHTAALLTTFNEIDMTEVMEIRKKYKDKFKEKYNVGLGFMSFFTKATSIALEAFPIINARVDGEDIIYHDYADIGVAVSTPKGLVVPVVRDAEQLSFSQIESTILAYALKGRSGQITPQDMEGGTFTITNGGVFGSMLSTPIVNQPQSAILGMHNIVDRPMAVNGEVKIRPIMYVALTYDHRIIDGSQAVSFLVKIKELIEDPTRLLIGI